jgi:signal transduction histidine kinase
VPRARAMSMAAAGLLMATVIAGSIWYLHVMRTRLPYHDAFASGRSDEWEAFGGTWSITDGIMRNESDERGAKLLAGSVRWTDYVLSGDVELLGRDGDAGLVVRASDEELGVDSYSGYYAGLRTRDNHLVLGRANHGWKEVQSVELPGGVQAFRWYRLQVVARGCEIVASAAPIEHPSAVTAVALPDKNCLHSGRIGLRSYSAGGSWKNVKARVATEEDVQHAMALVPPGANNSDANPDALDMNRFGSGARPSASTLPLPSPASSVQPIRNLRLAPPRTRATVRGVVILAKPALYVQDSTGGVMVSGATPAPAKIGDEVQVTGDVQSGYFSTHLHNATVSALWSHNPVLPLSISSSQAASGAFNSTFVEMEGTLRRKTWGPNGIVLEVESDHQPFEALVDASRGDRSLRHLEINSTLRLLGVCVVDPEYTHQQVPFVLLTRSADDLEVLSGPPWWNTEHILLLSALILVLVMIGYHVQNRVERWRWRTILEEREKLAHEIHDTLAQSFAGLGFQLEAIRDRVPEGIPQVHQQLDLACDLVRRSHQEARRSIVALRRDSTEHVELLDALETCAHRMVDQCGVTVSATQTGTLRNVPVALTDALFRIGQEAIANSVRHAQPTRIGISLDCNEQRVCLAIEDDGVGYKMGTESAGFGLQGIQKRARSIGGNAQIVSSPGRGTRVSVSAPVPRRLRWFHWPHHLWQMYGRYRSYAQAGKQIYPGPYSR